MHSKTGIWTWIGCFSLAFASGGCSTVLDMTGTERAGYQSDGSYVVSGAEEKLACRQIRERMDVLGGEISVLPAQAAEEQRNTPRTIGSAFLRMFGGENAGLKSLERYERAVAERDALNSLYARKRCI